MSWDFLYCFLMGPLLTVLDYAGLVSTENYEPKRRPHGLLIAVWMVIGFAIGVSVAFGIPKLLGLEFRGTALMLGVGVYLVWRVFSHRRWKRALDRARQTNAEVHGLGHTRIADLKMRKLTHFVSRPFLIAPYLVLVLSIAGTLFAAGRRPFAPPQSDLEFHLLVLLFGFALLVFFSWLMVRTVKNPVDLRSANPQLFAAKTHRLLRNRVRLLVTFQFVNVLFLILALWMYRYSLPYPIFVAFGLAPTLLCGFVLPIHSLIAGHKLEQERWTEITVN
jgi:Ca2+/Na+ antiporter